MLNLKICNIVLGNTETERDRRHNDDEGNDMMYKLDNWLDGMEVVERQNLGRLAVIKGGGGVI